MQRSVPVPATQHASPFPKLMRVFSGWRRQRLRQHALEWAYREFRATHTPSPDILFDLHFLKTRGGEALVRGDAEALAYAWTRQFRYRDVRQRQRDVRRLMPLCESFLELLQCQEAESGLP